MYKKSQKTPLETLMSRLGRDVDVIRAASGVDAESARQLRLHWIRLCALNDSKMPLDKEGLDAEKHASADVIIESLTAIRNQLTEEKLDGPENERTLSSLQALCDFITGHHAACGASPNEKDFGCSL